MITRLVLVTFFCSTLTLPPGLAQAQGMPWMPRPGVRVNLSVPFSPAQIKGMVVHQDDALKLDFLIYQGDEPLLGQAKEQEYQKLIKYFMAALTIPDENQWVNLSPYEKNRIIEQDFSQTEMGRDILAQDYLLKQITSSLMYPEESLGKKFWDKVFQRAQAQLGTTQIPLNTINKVWIVPDHALIYEKNNTVYVIESHLKVMMEQDYLATKKNNISNQPLPTRGHVPGAESGRYVSPSTLPSDQGSTLKAPQGNPLTTTKHSNNLDQTPTDITNKAIKDIILPEIEKEVNEGKNFAALRQVFSGMILAAWYKRALKESLLGKVYANRNKVVGVNLKDPAVNERIYQQYLRAYKKGVFSYIKEDIDKLTSQPIPRKYFSGGFMNAQFTSYAMVTNTFPPSAAISTNPSTIDAATVAIKVADQATVAKNIRALSDYFNSEYPNISSKIRVGLESLIVQLANKIESGQHSLNSAKKTIRDYVRLKQLGSPAMIAPGVFDSVGELRENFQKKQLPNYKSKIIDDLPVFPGLTQQVAFKLNGQDAIVLAPARAYFKGEEAQGEGEVFERSAPNLTEADVEQVALVNGKAVYVLKEELSLNRISRFYNIQRWLQLNEDFYPTYVSDTMYVFLMASDLTDPSALLTLSEGQKEQVNILKQRLIKRIENRLKKKNNVLSWFESNNLVIVNLWIMIWTLLTSQEPNTRLLMHLALIIAQKSPNAEVSTTSLRFNPDEIDKIKNELLSQGIIESVKSDGFIRAKYAYELYINDIVKLFGEEKSKPILDLLARSQANNGFLAPAIRLARLNPQELDAYANQLKRTNGGDFFEKIIEDSDNRLRQVVIDNRENPLEQQKRAYLEVVGFIDQPAAGVPTVLPELGVPEIDSDVARILKSRGLLDRSQAMTSNDPIDARMNNISSIDVNGTTTSSVLSKLTSIRRDFARELIRALLKSFKVGTQRNVKFKTKDPNKTYSADQLITYTTDGDKLEFLTPKESTPSELEAFNEVLNWLEDELKEENINNIVTKFFGRFYQKREVAAKLIREIILDLILGNNEKKYEGLSGKYSADELLSYDGSLSSITQVTNKRPGMADTEGVFLGLVLTKRIELSGELSSSTVIKKKPLGIDNGGADSSHLFVRRSQPRGVNKGKPSDTNTGREQRQATSPFQFSLLKNGNKDSKAMVSLELVIGDEWYLLNYFKKKFGGEFESLMRYLDEILAENRIDLTQDSFNEIQIPVENFANYISDENDLKLFITFLMARIRSSNDMVGLDFSLRHISGVSNFQNSVIVIQPVEITKLRLVQGANSAMTSTILSQNDIDTVDQVLKVFRMEDRPDLNITREHRKQVWDLLSKVFKENRRASGRKMFELAFGELHKLYPDRLAEEDLVKIRNYNIVSQLLTKLTGVLAPGRFSNQFNLAVQQQINAFINEDSERLYRLEALQFLFRFNQDNLANKFSINELKYSKELSFITRDLISWMKLRDGDNVSLSDINNEIYQSSRSGIKDRFESELSDLVRRQGWLLPLAQIENLKSTIRKDVNNLAKLIMVSKSEGVLAKLLKSFVGLLPKSVLGSSSIVLLSVGLHLAQLAQQSDKWASDDLRLRMPEQGIQSVANPTPTGGIDLNARYLDMVIKRDGRGVPLPLSQQNIDELMKIQGFIPVIIKIESLMNVPILSELKQQAAGHS